MSFAENLVYLRQHYGVTQEGLAEQLGVSRQTVSKWEAGTNYPEMDKLLVLCDLFHVSMDDLMRGAVSIAKEGDTERYDRHMNRYDASIVAGVMCILVGVGVAGIAEALRLPDNLQAVLLLSFVVVGVIALVMGGLTHHEFKRRNPSIEPRYDERTLERASRRFPLLVAGGVGLILLDVIFLVGLTPDDGGLVAFGLVVEDALMAPFMTVLAVAVGLLIWAGMQKSKFELSDAHLHRASQRPGRRPAAERRREVARAGARRTPHGRGLRRHHAAGHHRVFGVGLRAPVRPDRWRGRRGQVRLERSRAHRSGRLRRQLDRVRGGRHPVRHRVPGRQRGVEIEGRLGCRSAPGGCVDKVRPERRRHERPVETRLRGIQTLAEPRAHPKPRKALLEVAGLFSLLWTLHNKENDRILITAMR